MAVSILQVANPATGSASGPTQPVPVKQSTATSVSGTYFDHVIIILMENQGVYDICRSSPPPCSTSGPAPYMAGLANAYGIGARYLSLINTSQPNYIALIGGSTLGCNSSGCPTITAPNLVDRFETAGLTWKGYFENQNVAAGCDASSHEPYEPIHNPFTSFQDISTNTARCNQLVLANPNSCTVTDCALINDLNSASAPNFMWLTPNDCNDMRGASGICSASISLGDNYLKSLVPNILSSNTFKTGRSALFITFDEGNGYCPLNGSSESCVYSVWAGPAAKTSFGSNNLYNHYSFPKTIETNWNLASLSTGDGGATAMAEFFNPTSPSPDFSISANPTSLSTITGSTVTSTISLSSLNSFAGAVALAGTSSPSGLTFSLNPSTVSLSSGGTATSTLSVSSSNPGTYTAAITGTSGSLSHSTTVTVSVNAPADFSITANPSSLSFNAGSTSTSTISLASLNNFAGTVSLSATSTPSGLSLSMNPGSVSLSSGGTSSSTLSVSSSTAGNYTVVITGTSGSLSHQTTLTVSVSSTNTGDFGISPSPSSLSVNAGSTATSTITLTSLNGFTGTVTLSGNSSPAALTFSLSSTSVTLSSGGTSTSTLSVNSSTPGTYTVTVTGTSGSLSHATTVTVNVVSTNPGDFSITANPTSLTIPRGSSAGPTISLASLNGFSGTITLSATVSSTPGPKASLSSSTVTLISGGQGTASLSVRANHKTAIGTYTITVTGTSGSVSHSVSITVNVT